MKRPVDGLLGGMWEFLNLETEPDVAGASAGEARELSA